MCVCVCECVCVRVRACVHSLMDVRLCARVCYMCYKCEYARANVCACARARVCEWCSMLCADKKKKKVSCAEYGFSCVMSF